MYEAGRNVGFLQSDRRWGVYFCGMITIATFRELCLAMPDTSEVPHFDRRAFRTKRKIFATLLEEAQTANFPFSPEEQAAWCKRAPEAFSPVPGGWGLQGWTTVDLRKVKKSQLVDAVQSAWYNAAPPKLQEQYRIQNGL